MQVLGYTPPSAQYDVIVTSSGKVAFKNISVVLGRIRLLNKGCINCFEALHIGLEKFNEELLQKTIGKPASMNDIHDHFYDDEVQDDEVHLVSIFCLK